MFNLFKKDTPERESPSPEKTQEASSETATQTDELDALFDAAESNGDAEAPDLEALRQALSAKAGDDEWAESPVSAPEANGASNGEVDAPEAPPAFEEDSASPELEAPEAPEDIEETPPEEASPDEIGENGHASAQHKERLSWLVDYVSTEETSASDAAEEELPSEAAQQKPSRPPEASDAPPAASGEIDEKAIEAPSPEDSPAGAEEVSAQPPSEMSDAEDVDLEAFQQALRAQEEASDPAAEDVVTEDELEALFGEDEEHQEPESEAADETIQRATSSRDEEDTAEEASPEEWTTESTYTSTKTPTPPFNREETQPSSPTGEETEKGEEEPSEEATTERSISALYNGQEASESDSPEADAGSDAEPAAFEAEDSNAAEDILPEEAGTSAPETDDPVLESIKPGSTDDGAAFDETLPQTSREAAEEEGTFPEDHHEESGAKASGEEPGSTAGIPPEEEHPFAAQETTLGGAELSADDQTDELKPDEEGFPPEESFTAERPETDKEGGVADASHDRAPVLEEGPDRVEPGVQEPMARHGGSTATEDESSSPEIPAPASAPEDEPTVAVRTEAATDPAETAEEDTESTDEELDPEALAGSLHTDVLPGEDVTLKEKIESVQEEVINGDGHLEGISEPSADGHTLDLGGNTPVANISNWMEGAQYAAPAQEKAEEGGEEEASALDIGDRVVSFLLRSGAVTPEQVREAQERQNDQEATALWRVLAEINGVDREAVFAGATRVYAFPMADLEKHGPNPDFTKSVMEGFSEEKREQLLTLGLVPYRAVREKRREALKLLFITHDPARPEVNRLLERVSVEFFEVLYAPEAAVNEIIAEAFPKKNEYLERVEKDGGAVDLGTNYQEDDDLIDEDQLEAEISRSKLINLFEATLVEAVRQGASDIHIYPNAQKKVEIHFRIDGRLNHWHTEDKVHPEALLAVIKDNSINVDRFERDAAQDGFIQRRVDEALIRFRVSVMPIANASQEVRSESIVIRVLDDRKVIKDLSKLGLLEGALEKFEHAISQPHGMVIMTGPTGSGKSTTLVAALHRVVSPEVNVLTIEDPVEYIIEDVRQIKLSHKLKLEDALRSLLRHDPDVVMVGEMRDRSTAELAIKLANTGHLTFSTLHTNDAPSAVARLYKMGIEPFLIAYAINLVVAQRLIRKLCPECKRIDQDPDPVMLQKLGFSEEEIANTDFYLTGEDDNCHVCNGFGYKGRRAIAEAMYFSRELRHMIVEADRMIDEDALREQAQKEGMLTLQDSARQVVKMGDTSVREMIRVVTSDLH